MSLDRVAVVLFNMGGPEAPRDVKPFLKNIFSDYAILRLPWLLRKPLSYLIAHFRAPVAREIYNKIGGGSPLLANTIAQAEALEANLNLNGQFRVFIAMRYWRPYASTTVVDVKSFKPKHIVLLPLYPQYSTATTASSLAEWQKVAKKADLRVPTSTICCYPQNDYLAKTFATAIKPLITKANELAKPRLLFSAHGLPEHIVKSGDPYCWQVKCSVQKIIEIINVPDIDFVICFQSRVGPVKWVGPSTEEEISRAGKDERSVILVPITFVSDHSETMVELDIEYKHLAETSNVPAYFRVETPGINSSFITGLAELVKEILLRPDVFSMDISCKNNFTGCYINKMKIP